MFTPLYNIHVSLVSNIMSYILSEPDLLHGFAHVWLLPEGSRRFILLSDADELVANTRSGCVLTGARSSVKHILSGVD